MSSPTHPPAHGSGSAADVADLILAIARMIQAQEAHFTGVITLTNLERVVLRHIDRHPGSNPSTIASSLGLRSANMSSALRSLESLGLVERAPDPHDGRGVIVRPTRLAADNLERLRAQWAAVVSPADVDADALALSLSRLEETLSSLPRAT